MSLFFLMMAAAEAGIPFVYHETGLANAYVCLDVGDFFVPVDILPAILFTARAIVLIDSRTGDTPSAALWRVRGAHIVIASSAPSRQHTIVKEKRGRYFTMSLVSPDEFQDMLCVDFSLSVLRTMTVSLGSYLRTVSLRSNASFTSISLLGDATPQVPSIASVNWEPTDVDMTSEHGDDDNESHDMIVTSTGERFWHPLALYRHLGPNVRTALGRYPYETGNPLKDLLPLVTFPHLRVLWYCVSGLVLMPIQSHRSFPPRSEKQKSQDSDSQDVFFNAPGSKSISLWPPSNLVVPTPFLRSLAVRWVRDLHKTKQVELITSLRLRGPGTVHDIVFEAITPSYLARRYFKAVLPNESIVVGRHCRHCERFVAYNDTGAALPAVINLPESLSYLVDPIAGIPDKAAFRLGQDLASGDALLLADGDNNTWYELVLQATVVQRRPIKKSGITQLMEALDRTRHDHRRLRRRLFLFVSNTHENGAKLAKKRYPALEGWEVGYVVVAEEEFIEFGERHL